MTRTRPLRIVAIVLLLVSAFGGLSVGAALLAVEPGPASSAFDQQRVLAFAVGFAAYGLVSLAGAIAMVMGWRAAIGLVVVPQGLACLGLLLIYVAVAPEVSLLVVGANAGAAACCVLVDAWSRRND